MSTHHTPSDPARPRRDVRVVVADDATRYRDGIARAIDGTEGLVVAGLAGSVAEAVATIERERPDVVLVDLRMPDGSAADVVLAVRDLDDTPDPAFAVISAEIDGADASDLEGVEVAARLDKALRRRDICTRIAELGRHHQRG